MRKRNILLTIGVIIFFIGIFVTPGLSYWRFFLYPESYEVTLGSKTAGDEDSLDEKDDNNILKVTAAGFWWFWHYYHANVDVEFHNEPYVLYLFLDFATSVGSIRVWVYYTTGEPFFSGYINEGYHQFDIDYTRSVDYVHIWYLVTAPYPLTARLEVDLCIFETYVPI